MADTFYAWTNIDVPDADDPSNPRKVNHIRPGDTVTASDLNIDDEEFQYLVDAGAVRKYEYPDMGNFSGSPVELRKAQLAAAAEGGYFDTQYGTVGVDVPPPIDPETGKAIDAGTNAPSVTGEPANTPPPDNGEPAKVATTPPPAQ